MTEDEIAARREQARQRHAEMMANNAGVENGTPLILEPANKDNKENESNAMRIKPKEEKVVPKSHVLAFARVYSGTIKKGQQLYVLGPKHDPRESLGEDLTPLEDHNQTITDRYCPSKTE